jgi:excisionase family DNA binding protein
MNDVAAYTIAEAERRLGIKHTKIYRLIGDGTLPIIKLGRKTLILAKDLDEMLSKGRRIAWKPAPLNAEARADATKADVDPTPVVPPKKYGRSAKVKSEAAEGGHVR